MTVRMGLIGAGRIGRKHAETLRRLPQARLAGVADADEAAARAAVPEAGADVSVVTDHRRLLDDPGIDAVLIAAPTNLQGALIREAAEAGKQIFCEKPIALTLAEADEALAAVARAGVTLQIGFQRRFDPAYERAQKAIRAGAVEVGHARDTGLLRLDRRGVTADYPYWFLDRFGPAYEREVADFVRCVAEGASVRATGRDGRQALAVVLAAADSAREGRPVE